ncbi:hypothetical protein BKA93DRAFT_243406 [Sparassis latifolia]
MRRAKLRRYRDYLSHCLAAVRAECNSQADLGVFNNPRSPVRSVVVRAAYRYPFHFQFDLPAAHLLSSQLLAGSACSGRVQHFTLRCATNVRARGHWLHIPCLYMWDDYDDISCTSVTGSKQLGLLEPASNAPSDKMMEVIEGDARCVSLTR